MVPDLTKQCKGIGAHVRHHYWNKISRAGQLVERDHPVWQLPTSGAMHSGSFLPIFWDAPFSYLHASTDIGEVVDWIKGKFVVATKGDLAVLHNRNKMVNAFSTTEWVSGSGGTIISRSVTSCAGMTAYLVLLAQTRVGFLRKKLMHELLLLLPGHNKFALSWARWTCVGW